jgi:hypothetical protein
MFGRVRYDRLTDAQLAEQYGAWCADHDEWHDFVGQFGTSRAVRRGLRRCLRHIRRIEVVARRRRLAL